MGDLKENLLKVGRFSKFFQFEVWMSSFFVWLMKLMTQPDSLENS